MIRAITVALTLLAAAPSAAEENAWWADWAENPYAPRLWYRLKPSFIQQGPWVFVRFDRDAPGSAAESSERWIVTRVQKFLPATENGEEREVRQTTDSESCPAILDLMKSAGPALSGAFDTDPASIERGAFVNDGVIVTVGAFGLQGPDLAIGSITVDGNLNIPAADWAYKAEKALKPCWTPAS